MTSDTFEPWTVERVKLELVKLRLRGGSLLLFKQRPDDLNHRGPWGGICTDWSGPLHGRFVLEDRATPLDLRMGRDLVAFLNAHRLILCPDKNYAVPL